LIFWSFYFPQTNTATFDKFFKAFEMFIKDYYDMEIILTPELINKIKDTLEAEK